MAKIIWEEKFSIQNEAIDNQHKRWIGIYNKTHDQMMSKSLGAKKLTIGKEALKEMIDYGKRHFEYEEQYMERVGYPDIDRHKQIHKDFSERMDGLDERIHQGVYVLNSEIVKVIENWLIDHILNEDQKITKAQNAG